MRTQWNTGRLYQRDGQVIVAVFIPQGHRGGVVQFCDHSRMIDGQFEVSSTPGSESELRDRVMHHYDHNDYTWIRERADLRRQA